MAETGAELIAAERQRQIDAEGWTPEHDDTHRDGELRWAAVHYLGGMRPWGEIAWPWIESFACLPKPHGPLRDLIRAGALIAAEIDRLNRATPEGDGR